MSRIRTLKPEFFRSRSLAKVSRDARLTFQGMWCHADDAGRGVADALILKGLVWPLELDLTAEDVERHMRELETTGHIRFYEVDGERYYLVLKFEQHQAAAYRKAAPKYPAPPGVQDAYEDVHAAHEGVLEGKGREGKGPSPRKAERDALWDALTAAFGEPQTASEKSNRGRHVRELLEAQATPEAIAARIREHSARKLTWTLTANALLTHWTDLAPRRADVVEMHGARMSREALGRM